MLWFNRNTKEAKGNLIFRKGDKKDEYPVFYDKEGIHLLDENAPEYIREGLSKFKMMYEVVEVDREYLDNLKNKNIMYSDNSSLFNAHYELNKDDKNIAKIKEIYSNLSMNNDKYKLVLEGKGTPWKIKSRVSMRIILDETNNNYFTSAIVLQESEELK